MLYYAHLDWGCLESSRSPKGHLNSDSGPNILWMGQQSCTFLHQLMVNIPMIFGLSTIQNWWWISGINPINIYKWWDVYHPKLVMYLAGPSTVCQNVWTTTTSRPRYALATHPGSSLGLHAVHRQLQPNTPDEAQPVPANRPDFLGVSWDFHGIFAGFYWDFNGNVWGDHYETCRFQ